MIVEKSRHRSETNSEKSSKGLHMESNCFVGYHTFRTNLNGICFIDILKHYLLPSATIQFKP